MHKLQAETPKTFFEAIANRKNGAVIFDQLSALAGMKKDSARQVAMSAIRIEHDLPSPQAPVTQSLRYFFTTRAHGKEVLCGVLPQCGDAGACVTVAALVKSPGVGRVCAVFCDLTAADLADKRKVVEQVFDAARVAGRTQPAPELPRADV